MPVVFLFSFVEKCFNGKIHSQLKGIFEDGLFADLILCLLRRKFWGAEA